MTSINLRKQFETASKIATQVIHAARAIKAAAVRRADFNMLCADMRKGPTPEMRRDMETLRASGAKGAAQVKKFDAYAGSSARGMANAM